ncbi:armadillo-type protein [Gorgonomyces haynaldii]|nr:armadillo-type protein [Gorgonomyces haynaldii]
MGNSLTTQLEWQPEKPALTKDGLPLLQTSVQNQDALLDVVKKIEQLCQNYPIESKAEFRKPLVWQSNVPPSQYSASQQSQLWIAKEGSKNHKSSVNSVGNRPDGQPWFTAEQTPSGFQAKVWSFDYLNKFLQVAGESKLKELQSIVQACRDPFSVIFGVSNDKGNALVEAFDQFNNESDPKKREKYTKLYKLLLIVNSFDLEMLQSAVKGLSKGIFLDMHKVTEEYEMLASFCGKEDQHALLSIQWESDFTFANGVKAPPWRQVYHELCYMNIRTHDKDPVIVTATKKGYFINKGYTTDERGNEILNYESVSETYPTIVELLKSYSPHFSSHIDSQGYLFRKDQVETTAVAAEKEDYQEEEQETPDRVEEPQRRKDKEVVIKSGGNKKSSAKQQQQVEPSLKWRALGLVNEPQVKRLPIKSSAQKRVQSPSKGKKGAKHSEEDFSESDSDVTSEEESAEKRQESNELHSEYYQIQKLIKYLRSGNQTATIIAICSLRDFDLSHEVNQLAIRDVGGLETIVNLLDTDDPKCRIGALKILKDIAQNVQIRSAIASLDGMRPLVALLKDSDDHVKCLAAETIAHCAKNASNRRSVRRYGGIKKLVKLLKTKAGTDEAVAIAGALALQSCSKSSKNKEAIQAAGSIPLLANLLESQNEKLLIPVVGILQECASDEHYRVAIRDSGMIKFLVENLSSKNQQLQTHSASAIFKCAEEDATRVLVHKFNGLTPLVTLLDNIADRELLAAATGAVWKCAQNLDNVAAFNKLNTIKKLVGLMENQPEDVLVNVVGALGACAKTEEGRKAIRESGGITPLVNLLTGTNQALLVNVTTAVGACALDNDSMAVIDRLDGVRLLWSLLKSPNPMVQASAAWAISPCIEHAKDAGEMVRSFVGGLELIVSLLKSDNTEVLASVCAAIANIAKDEENLAVITDHGVVPMLGKLTHTKNDKLRKHLAEAIARCCHWGNNRVAFGSAQAVAPLVKYLKSPDHEVHRSTARALHQLSMDPDNCISMHEHGVVQLLLGMVGSKDPDLQEAAAGTIGNIRRLALASEKATQS